MEAVKQDGRSLEFADSSLLREYHGSCETK